jgi:hypothetical protein
LLIAPAFFILSAIMTTRELEKSRRGLVEAAVSQTSQGPEALMIEKADEPKKRDYSCEIISFIVLAVLSELSHFWYILIAICTAIAFWGAILLLGRLAQSAVKMFPWRPPAKQPKNSNTGDSGGQVFLPSKIRQSADC